jgi:hypothetical protein
VLVIAFARQTEAALIDQQILSFGPPALLSAHTQQSSENLNLRAEIGGCGLCWILRKPFF